MFGLVFKLAIEDDIADLVVFNPKKGIAITIRHDA